MSHTNDAAPAATMIRPATRDDAAAVRCLTRAAYAKWVSVIGREPLPMTADHAAAVQHHRVDLLLMDDMPIGLIEMIPACDHLLVENVAVLPACQGRGYGRKLMAHAETVAAQSGFTELRLYTNKRFTTNVALYAALGYLIDRETPFGNGVTVHMSKKLQPSGTVTKET